MADRWQVYRDAIAQRVHTICFDRNLDPDSTVDTEAECRIERFLPQLVEAAQAIGPNDPAAFEAAFEQRVCAQCGQRDALGRCPIQAKAACCLYRYLPLVYQAIHQCQTHSS